MRVAGKYLPQQSLIGPALFPLYKFVLKAVSLGYLTPWILVWAGMMVFIPSYRASHSGTALLGTWAQFLEPRLHAFRRHHALCLPCWKNFRLRSPG